MTRSLLLATCILFVPTALAEPSVYICYVYTQQRGAPESPVFRFTVEGTHATLSYTYRPNPDQAPQQFEIPLQVLNNSERSLVLGSLTEGDKEQAPRYDVWVLDKKNLLLSSEITRPGDASNPGLEQRTGNCRVENSQP